MKPTDPRLLLLFKMVPGYPFPDAFFFFQSQNLGVPFSFLIWMKTPPPPFALASCMYLLSSPHGFSLYSLTTPYVHSLPSFFGSMLFPFMPVIVILPFLLWQPSCYLYLIRTCPFRGLPLYLFSSGLIRFPSSVVPDCLVALPLGLFYQFPHFVGRRSPHFSLFL